MTTDDHRFALELSDFPRSYREIAGALTRGLVARYMKIDQLAVADVFMAITGYLAQRTGRTPRTVLEDYFEMSPDDEWWRRKMAEGEAP